jgi:hypothetical protein
MDIGQNNNYYIQLTCYIQVVPTRLIQAVRNKLLRVCSHQLVKNLLLRVDDIRLVGTTCCESLLASSTLLQDYNNRLLGHV